MTNWSLKTWDLLRDKTMTDACCAESKITSETGPTAHLQWNLLTVGLYLTEAWLEY